MEIQIQKLKLKNMLPEVHYSLSKEEVYAQHEAKIFNPVHEDLQKAVNKLTLHMCLITEMLNPNQLTPDGATPINIPQESDYHEHFSLSRFTCTGFSLSSDGVVLIGQKALGTKKVLNIISPFTLLNEDSDYDYSSELYEAIELCKAEAIELLNGKHGGQQMELEFNAA